MPAGVILCIDDAIYVYTNIDADEGMYAIEKYLKKFSFEIEEHLDQPLTLELLNLVMNHCIFKF